MYLKRDISFAYVRHFWMCKNIGKKGGKKKVRKKLSYSIKKFK